MPSQKKPAKQHGKIGKGKITENTQGRLVEAKFDKNVCVICLQRIVVQIFKGTGVCCENHRKIRDEEL